MKREEWGLSAKGTGLFSKMRVGLVFIAIGYKSDKLNGVPFDPKKNIIPNIDGRVTDPSGKIIPGAYTTGWVRRGAKGVIGSNKGDARGVAKLILEDLERIQPITQPETSIVEVLEANGVAFTTKEEVLNLV